MSSLVERSFIDNKELIVLEYSYYRFSFKWCFSVSKKYWKEKEKCNNNDWMEIFLLYLSYMF